MLLPLEEKRNRVLVEAYNLHCANPSIDLEKLEKIVGLEPRTEFYDILKYFGAKGWLIKSGMYVRFSPEGLDAAMQLVKKLDAEKEREVLEAIADMSRMCRDVLFPSLMQRLGMSDNELSYYCNRLADKNAIHFPGGDVIQMKPAGHKILNPPEPTTPHIVINNPTNSPMSFGAHSSQTVTYNNQSVQEILPALSRLIEDAYNLDFPTRSDVIAELQKVEILAKEEMNAGKWQLIQSRLLTTKTALEIAKLGADSLPYWPIVWNFFFK